MDNEVDPILNGIASWLNFTPLYFIYKQFVYASIAPITIAASPPNRRNARKIIESEKLKMNFERGNIMLIRGAINIVKRNKSSNFHEKTSVFILNKANVRHAPPRTAIESL